MPIRGLTAALNSAGRYSYKTPEGVVDHLIIGGGVVGLSIAEALVRQFPEKSTYLVERNKCAGEETSSRSSEVIHAGLYYPKDSLKLRCCLRGKQLLYERCKAMSIPHSRIGKLVVGRREQRQYLIDLHEHCRSVDASQENPPGSTIEAELITGNQARELEPDLSDDIELALLSHSTGIVDSHSLMDALEEDINNSENGDIVYSSAVVRIDPHKPSGQQKSSSDPSDEGWVIQTSTGGNLDAILARNVINAAGLSSHLILNAILPEPLPIFYARGSYASYNGSGANVSRLIYPVPERGSNQHAIQSLGTHLTLDLEGNVRFGPDLEYISPPHAQSQNSDHESDVDYWKAWLKPDESRTEKMHKEIIRYLPDVKLDGLNPDYVGIRPKLGGPQSGFHDFTIRTDRTNGGAPMISLLGIESPGLTSCLALGEVVSQSLAPRA